MSRLTPIIGTLAAALAMATCATVSPGIARAQHAGHAQHHDVYKEWMRPHMPNVGCCNAKRTVDGDTTGDCYPTQAEPRPSSNPALGVVWWARKDSGEWVEIPDSRIVLYANPDESGQRAHLCESYGHIHCFRPPATGG